jgi:hypothetical protein
MGMEVEQIVNHERQEIEKLKTQTPKSQKQNPKLKIQTIKTKIQNLKPIPLLRDKPETQNPKLQ